ncbi:MAG: Adenylate cyclase [uncultured Propionibacteriaceae bacterium]|uniref:Adenylate cyclase n=1 Tax=uncultured Propionibacteriaceae bacterium TaxID=257457 RepID=A0A6J4NBL5_9ACTN|nr:MAG: Adenylate cyclase [uncultured Propionibacteriaceae bacterium]
MGIFQRFEKKVEGAVNGVFARAFKGDVQPVEIAARLQRELDAEAKLMSRDKRLVPNEFIVGLSQHDHDKLAPYSKTLTSELAGSLKDHAESMGYLFSGPIRIHLELDDSLPVGRFTVDSRAVAAVEANGKQGTADGRAQLVLEVNGVRHPLQPPGLVIGRGTEADLRINDPGISRRHAEIRVSGGAGRVHVDIVDLGSTNGIIVNGQRVRHAELGAGSRIEIGSTRMLVHAPAGH